MLVYIFGFHTVFFCAPVRSLFIQIHSDGNATTHTHSLVRINRNDHDHNRKKQSTWCKYRICMLWSRADARWMINVSFLDFIIWIICDRTVFLYEFLVLCVWTTKFLDFTLSRLKMSKIIDIYVKSWLFVLRLYTFMWLLVFNKFYTNIIWNCAMRKILSKNLLTKELRESVSAWPVTYISF